MHELTKKVWGPIGREEGGTYTWGVEDIDKIIVDWLEEKAKTMFTNVEHLVLFGTQLRRQTLLDGIKEHFNLTKPEPVWCEHIRYEGRTEALGKNNWYFNNYPSDRNVYATDHFKLCPICGAKKP